MSQLEFQQLIAIARKLQNREICIINSCLLNGEGIVANELARNGNVFVANASLDRLEFPMRQRCSRQEFKEQYLEIMKRRVFNLTHSQLLDPKFEEFAPLVDENSVLVIADADEIADSARTAFSMHITSSFAEQAMEEIRQVCIPAAEQCGPRPLESGSKSIIEIHNFDFAKDSHVNAFFRIGFRPSAYKLKFLRQKYIPELTAEQFTYIMLRCCQALIDMLESRNHIQGRTLSDYETIFVPDAFLLSIIKDYSLDIEILQQIPEYYDIFLKRCALEPSDYLISLTQFIQLIAVYCDPSFEYQAELNDKINDERFYASNSFHLIIQKQRPVRGEHEEISLTRSAAVLKFICSDPLVALRYILERFRRIIFISPNIPFDYKTTNGFQETLSSKCRINYFNRKSIDPLSTCFVEVASRSEKFIRFERKGSDQTLITSYYLDLTPQMALNFEKFIDQRCSQSRDGVIVCTPSKHFTSELAYQLEIENIPVASHQLTFFSSQDQSSTITCTRQFKLCCDIGRGGVFVEDCSAFQASQFKNEYNSISLIIGVPFPTKSLQNKLRAFYEYNVRQEPADEYWCEIAARNVVKIAAGPEATILADMRYDSNEMIDLIKYFPKWFQSSLKEEGANCLAELKNWVIQRNK